MPIRSTRDPNSKESQKIRDRHGNIVKPGQAFVDIHGVFHPGTDDYHPIDYSTWFIHKPSEEAQLIVDNPWFVVRTEEPDLEYVGAPTEEYVPYVEGEFGPYEQDFNYLTRQQFYRIRYQETNLVQDIYDLLFRGIVPSTGSEQLPLGTPGQLNFGSGSVFGKMNYEDMGHPELNRFHPDVGGEFGGTLFYPTHFGGLGHVPGGYWGLPKDDVYEEYLKTGSFGIWGLESMRSKRTKTPKHWGLP